MWGRRRRRQSVDEYAQDRADQLHQLGGEVDVVSIVELEPGEIKLQAVVRGFGLGRGRGYLSLLEIIRLGDDGCPTRAKYSYQAMYGRERLFRYDRDPIQHPDMPEHKHIGQDERRERAGRVTLNAVMQELWREINLRER